MTEWSRHSIIFGDAADHFPNDDLGILFRLKLLSSVRPRDFAAEFFNIVYRTRNISRVGTKFADLPRAYVGRVCQRTVRASFFLLFLLPARTQLPGFLLSNTKYQVCSSYEVIIP